MYKYYKYLINFFNFKTLLWNHETANLHTLIGFRLCEYNTMFL